MWNLGCGLFWDFARVTQARFPSGAFFRAALPPPPEKLNPVTLPATRFTRAGFQLPWGPSATCAHLLVELGPCGDSFLHFSPSHVRRLLDEKASPPRGLNLEPASFLFLLAQMDTKSAKNAHFTYYCLLL